MGLVRHILSWLLAAVLIAGFLHITVHPWPNPPSGLVQLYDMPGENIVFATLAERSGYSQLEPAGRFVTALLELVAAFLLLFPPTRRFGGGLAFCIMAVAVAAHLSPWLGREVPASLASGETGTDGGSMFMLAVAMLVASLLVVVVHPRKERLY